MSKRWDAIRGSAGFYITMAVCLLVIGVSSYYLLFDRKDPAPAPGPGPPPRRPAGARPAPASPVMPEIEIDDTPVVAEAPLQIVTPLDGEVVTAFSMDQLVYNPTLQDWRTHDGVDISAAEGTAVLAACAGTVLAVEEDAMMGTTVILEHDGGYQTTYANLQEQPGVGAGEAVSAGQILGAVGCTAAAEAAQEPHLHFSVTKDGENMDPNEFLRSVS